MEGLTSSVEKMGFGMSLASEIEEALRGKKLSELQAAAGAGKESEPLILEHTQQALDAFHILAEKELTACPVQDDFGKIIGTLDLRDAVKFVVDASTKHDARIEFQADISARPFKSSQIKHLARHPQVSQGLGYLAKMRPFKVFDSHLPAVQVQPDQAPRAPPPSQPGPWVPREDEALKVFDSQCDLTEVARDLSTGKHIVGCVDGQFSKAVGMIVTQKMLFNAVAPSLKNAKIPLEQVMSSPAICIKASAKAFEAFQLMTTHDVSGLAVVDKHGHIIHNVSSNDIKLWVDHTDEDQAPLDLNEMSVEDFLVKVRANNKELQVSSGKTRAPVCTCVKGDTVGHAVTLIQRTGYHHVWIVNEDKKPLGVIAMTDLFKTKRMEKAQCA
eukprot:CAMPEP_0172023950 /NCGR_PEP_ID=MMETSP1041-20130122/15069_1 /TAXON_ID=464988 /ORGANISM="Hemiselmis andersenii, Strain CCMP439" /LENGTH=385 /DNA_ID=CAMNT_0012679477 /DNA_START=295 /DNA_END=1453 /DNA_ORIENTATION=-